MARGSLRAALVACVPVQDRASVVIAAELADRFGALASDLGKLPGVATRLRFVRTRRG